jgi:hypothetical protein
MRNRKKSGWAFWLTVGLILLPMLYVASFGPACAAVARRHLPARRVAWLFRPLLAVAHRENPAQVSRPSLHAWAHFCDRKAGWLGIREVVEEYYPAVPFRHGRFTDN